MSPRSVVKPAVTSTDREDAPGESCGR